MDEHMRKKFLEHLVGPTGSVIMHVVVFLLALKFVSFVGREEAPEVEVMMMEMEAVDIEELEELKEEIEDLELPDVDVQVDVYVDAPVPEEVSEFESEEPDVDFDALDVVEEMSSPLVMKGLFSGRSAGGRAGMLNKYGGKWSQVTEAAVQKALQWLKDNQLPDGSWNKEKSAMTGLALLTYLAHGETPGSKEYGKTVEKAIRYLVDSQPKNGFWTSAGGAADGHHKGGNVYAHAIATYAISEAYGMTRIPELKPVMEKGVEVIINGQQPGGAWDYKYAKGERRDTSVSGWHVQALKAAYLAGSENPRIKEAMDKSVEDLKSVFDPSTGSFHYGEKKGNVNMAMTGVGTLCMQLLGYDKSSEVSKGVSLLKKATCDWEHPEPHAAMYAWYYITQVKFHKGGSTWSSWNNEFARTITGNQESDGRWEFPVHQGGKQEHGANQGPVYSTTLAALMLQVYYRNLPTFKEKAVQGDQEEVDEDEIVIEII